MLFFLVFWRDLLCFGLSFFIIGACLCVINDEAHASHGRRTHVIAAATRIL